MNYRVVHFYSSRKKAFRFVLRQRFTIVERRLKLITIAETLSRENFELKSVLQGQAFQDEVLEFDSRKKIKPADLSSSTR